MDNFSSEHIHNFHSCSIAEWLNVYTPTSFCGCVYDCVFLCSCTCYIRSSTALILRATWRRFWDGRVSWNDGETFEVPNKSPHKDSATTACVCLLLEFLPSSGFMKWRKCHVCAVRDDSEGWLLNWSAYLNLRLVNCTCLIWQCEVIFMTVN